jgi:hypothetical protein
MAQGIADRLRSACGRPVSRATLRTRSASRWPVACSRRGVQPVDQPRTCRARRPQSRTGRQSAAALPSRSAPLPWPDRRSHGGMAQTKCERNGRVGRIGADERLVGLIAIARPSIIAHGETGHPFRAPQSHRVKGELRPMLQTPTGWSKGSAPSALARIMFDAARIGVILGSDAKRIVEP